MMNLSLDCTEKREIRNHVKRDSYDSGWIRKGKIPLRAIVNIPAEIEADGFTVNIQGIKLPGGVDWEYPGDSIAEGSPIRVKCMRISKNDMNPEMLTFQRKLSYGQGYLYITVYLPHYVLQREIEVTLS